MLVVMRNVWLPMKLKNLKSSKNKLFIRKRLQYLGKRDKQMTSQKASLCQYQNSVLSVKEKGQKKKSFIFMKYLSERQILHTADLFLMKSPILKIVKFSLEFRSCLPMSFLWK